MISDDLTYKFSSVALKKNAVTALPLAAIAVVFYPFFYGSFFTFALFIIPIFYLAINGVGRISVTGNIVRVAIVMMIAIVALFNNYTEQIIFTFLRSESTGSYTNDFLLTAAVCFTVFFIGYAYGFRGKKPFSVLGYVFLYQFLSVIIYLWLKQGIDNTYNLVHGIILVVLLPYIYLILFDKRNYKLIIFTISIMLYLILIGSRTALGAVLIFTITYYLYPYLIRKKNWYKLYFIIFIMISILLQYLYMSGGLNFLGGFMLEVFGKNIDSGRIGIWRDLMIYILDKPVLGYGANQSSSYLVSSYNELRNLSSHNLYLEILLRGGVLLFVIIFVLFYSIWISFYSFVNNSYSRIAASGMIAFLFLSMGVEVGLSQNIIINSLVWLFWGMAAGKNQKMREMLFVSKRVV